MLQGRHARPDRAGRLRALRARAVSARRAPPTRSPGWCSPRPGGPFRGWAAADLDTVTPEQAGAHPTWSMGPMNTLNSASLVNKGLELIETHLLFGVPYDDIEVVVHPQSIVHSMVTFTDGSTIAQASPPDMKLPIALALGWPTGCPVPPRPATSRTASTWEFEPLDAAVFPAVELARRGRTARRLPDRGLQRRERGGGRRIPGRADPIPGDRAHDRRRAATPQTSGPPNPLPWKTYLTRSAGPGTGQGARYRTGGRHPPDDVGHRRRAVRAGHPGVGRAARVRPHVGGARHRDEGAPLLRRLRSDSVVHAAAQQAGLHRVRRQGHPARRVLRHRRDDVGRRTRAGRRAATRCTSRRRGSAPRCCSPAPP